MLLASTPAVPELLIDLNAEDTPTAQNLLSDTGLNEGDVSARTPLILTLHAFDAGDINAVQADIRNLAMKTEVIDGEAIRSKIASMSIAQV